jgi:hypothetical protein
LYFFEAIVNGVSFLETLRNFIIPELTFSGMVEQMLFQQDGPAIRFVQTVREFINGDWARFSTSPLYLHPVLT